MGRILAGDRLLASAGAAIIGRVDQRRVGGCPTCPVPSAPGLPSQAPSQSANTPSLHQETEYNRRQQGTEIKKDEVRSTECASAWPPFVFTSSVSFILS